MLSALREALYRQLDPEAWPGTGMSPLNWFLLVAIVLSIGFGVMATEPTFERLLKSHLYEIERLILLMFAAELLARLWVSGLNPRFSGVSGFFRFLIKPATIADIIVIIPLFLATPPAWTMVLRLMRILRLLRLASFPGIQLALREFREALVAKRFEFGISLACGLFLILISSTVLFLIERHIQPDIFGSIPRAIWWSVVTFTTVGYGDAVPITVAGRFFTGVFAICGVGIVAMLTGVVASALSDAAEIHARNKEDGPQG